MSVAGLSDIFQEKMMSFMNDFEYVRAYIDDLLIILKDSLKDHLTKLDKVLKNCTKPV